MPLPALVASAAGDTLNNILAKLTRNRVMAAVTGAFVTAVLNSSSVTTVLVVVFISAGFMTMAQSVGVITGANIGSTFTAQIVAKNDVREIAERFLQRQSKRIGRRRGARLGRVRLEMELLDKLRGVYTLTKRIAKDFVPLEARGRNQDLRKPRELTTMNAGEGGLLAGNIEVISERIERMGVSG